MKKELLATCAASLFFIACGDSSSTSATDSKSTLPKGDSPYCVVKKKGDGATQEIYEPGIGVGESGVTFKNGVATAFVNMTYEAPAENYKKLCKKVKNEAEDVDEGSFSCDSTGYSYTISLPEEAAYSLKEILEDMKSECEALKEDWDEEYGSDNGDDENSSSSKKASSSSAKNGSSSSVKSGSSSSVKSGSSSSVRSGSSSSSKENKVTSSSSIGKDLSVYDVKLSGDAEYNAITDKRDGKKYRVVKIGNQVWFLDNLAFEGSEDYPVVGMVYGYNYSSNGVRVVLYDYAAAMNNMGCKNEVCNEGNAVVQGVCPQGWALPTHEAWTVLSENIADFGYNEFFPQPTGERSSQWLAEDSISRYWTSTEDGNNGAFEWYRYNMYPDNMFPEIKYQTYSKSFGYGVRCIAVKDVVLDSYVEPPSSSVDDLCVSLGICESSSSMGDASSSSFVFNSTYEYGTFTDARDGEIYPYRVINGIKWMAEDLRFSDSELVPKLKDSVWCIGGEEQCGNGGMLYTFAAAQEACPAGWTLPTMDEWKSFAEEMYGIMYMNELIFAQLNIKATGEHGLDGYKKDEYARFWTSVTNGMVAFNMETRRWGSQYFNPSYGYAVRCIQRDDTPAEPAE